MPGPFLSGLHHSHLRAASGEVPTPSLLRIGGGEGADWNSIRKGPGINHLTNRRKHKRRPAQGHTRGTGEVSLGLEPGHSMERHPISKANSPRCP